MDSKKTIVQYNFDTKKGLVAHAQKKDGIWSAVCYIYENASPEDFNLVNDPPRKISRATNIKKISAADSIETIEEKCKKIIGTKKDTQC